MRRNLQLAVLAVFAAACLLPSLSVAHSADPLSQNKNAAQGSRDPSVLFAKNCATCHGKDGQAKTFKAKFNKARNLTDAAWQASVSDAHLFNSISNGKGKMPAFGKKFSESEINALVAYVRKFKK